MKRLVYVLFVVLLLSLASAITLTFNSPDDSHTLDESYQLLNISATSNVSDSFDLEIYGSSSSSVSNSSLLYKTSLANATDATYNWTSPKLTADANTMLLMYFDNQTAEYNDELSSDSSMFVLMHMNNESASGENDTLVYDFSGNDNNGTVYGAALSNGKFNSSFEFDGTDDYIDYGAGADLNWALTDNWTYEFWIKIPATEIDGPIISQRSSTTSYPLLDIVVGYDGNSDIGDGELGLLIRGNNNQGLTQVDSNTAINDNQWHHIAVVRNTKDDKFYIYIDADLKASGTDGLNDAITTDLRDIATSQRWVQDGYATADRRWLNCLIDEFAVYNRPLTTAEIRTHALNKVVDENNINNGTTNAIFNHSGKLGEALEFDGADDYVNVSDSDCLDLTQDFSLSFWLYPTDLSSDQTFLVKGSATTVNYYIDYKSAGDLEFGYYNGDWRSISVDASNFTADNWNLVTVTRDSSANTSAIYINGELSGDLQINYNPASNSEDLILGYFPGYGQYYSGLIDELVIYNSTLSSSEVADVYRLADGTWYWKFSAEDSEGINISDIRSFTIGNVWSVTPSDLGSAGTSLNTNVTLGTLLINNTHTTENVTIDIASDYSGALMYNEDFPFNLTPGESKSIQINATSPITEGTTTITFNITGTDPETGLDSIPSMQQSHVILIATSSQPYLITNFETYPTIVSQGNAGLNIVGSVANRGQGNAQNVEITFDLPSGWTNSSGALTQNLGILLVNEQKNGSIEVDVGSSATSGTVTLRATAAGQNSTADELNSSYILEDSVNVTVNSVDSGSGPSLTTSSSQTTGRSGGGGGSLYQGINLERDLTQYGTELITSAEEIELVRGKENSFTVDLKNIFKHTVLDKAQVKISGYLSQYLDITPTRIDGIDYDETKTFEITIRSPQYLEQRSYDLDVIITADIVGAGIDKQLLETRQIKLWILDIGGEDARTALDTAKASVARLSSDIPYLDELNKLLNEAEQAFESRDYKRSKEISDRILLLEKNAYEAEDIIRALSDLVDTKAAERKTVNTITGSFIDISDSFESAKNLLNLARAAFERGDFGTALKRAKEAELAFDIESAENFNPMYYLLVNWYWVLLVICISGFFSFTGYTHYISSTISDKIVALTNEEDNIKVLTRDAQKDYYNKKNISLDSYNRTIAQYNRRVAEIKKERIRLRNKRLRLLKPKNVLIDLDKESKEHLNAVKKLQKDYYEKYNLTTQEYEEQLRTYSEALAETEDERLTIETMLEKKGKRKIKDEWVELNSKKDTNRDSDNRLNYDSDDHDDGFDSVEPETSVKPATETIDSNKSKVSYGPNKKESIGLNKSPVQKRLTGLKETDKPKKTIKINYSTKSKYYQLSKEPAADAVPVKKKTINTFTKNTFTKDTLEKPAFVKPSFQKQIKKPLQNLKQKPLQKSTLPTSKIVASEPKIDFGKSAVKSVQNSAESKSRPKPEYLSKNELKKFFPMTAKDVEKKK